MDPLSNAVLWFVEMLIIEVKYLMTTSFLKFKIVKLNIEIIWIHAKLGWLKAS